MAELLIAAGPGEWRAAWVEDGEARELYVERGDTKVAGSRHLGRIVQVVPAQKNVKRWSIPQGSGRAATRPEERMALISEPQSNQPPAWA